MANRFSVEAIFKAVDKFTAPVTAMQNRMGKFTRSINNNLRSVNNSISSVANGLWDLGKSGAKLAGLAVAGLTAGVVYLAHAFSKIEDAQANFTPLMGSADKARQLVDALNVAAAKTPFEFNDLSAAAQQILPNMNGDIQKTIDTINMLGDAAGGNAQKLESITRGYNKALLKGKVDLESLNMVAEAGVPIYAQMAKVLNTTPKKLFKQISAGKITTEQLTKTFKVMTSEGGIFFNGMDIASRTMSGMWSTLMDDISQTAAALGEVLAPTIKELIGGADGIAQRLRTWIKANQEFIRTKFVEYVTKAREVFGRLLDKFKDTNASTVLLDALVDGFLYLVKLIDWVSSHGDTIVKFGETVLVLAAALKVLGIVMGVVNLVMLANPIGLIILAIVAAIAAIAAIIIWWDDLVAAFNKLPDWVQGGARVFLMPLILLVEAIRNVGAAWDWVSKKFETAGKWLGLIDNKTVDVNQNTTPANPQSPLMGLGGSAANAQMVSPQDRAAQTINESRTTNYAELTIRDPNNRTDLTQKGSSPGISFLKTSTGAF